MISIQLNGQKIPLESSSISALLEVLPTTDGIVISINHKVISRSLWQNELLSDGDVVDVFQAIAGG
ncbi:thiamine biosynthesis protein ThiS [Catenovulum agarivorans DS-2]|uniref:Thiamine biosynthesis protein ThiS n=1 Tax=Catenovulum agarivorans DS-2 TaxID=1328313 RepID=W7Q8J7_9ALTE|nr:sulfur carrier protein ThiS [Catenovulum agarivorans]EWH08336.1 thiamine biosynthesis protein ThiS [Catenovulum agarivorans DS-2]